MTAYTDRTGFSSMIFPMYERNTRAIEAGHSSLIFPHHDGPWSMRSWESARPLEQAGRGSDSQDHMDQKDGV